MDSQERKHLDVINEKYRWVEYPSAVPNKLAERTVSLMMWDKQFGYVGTIARIDFYPPVFKVMFYRSTTNNSATVSPLEFTSLEEAKAYAYVTHRLSKGNI